MNITIENCLLEKIDTLKSHIGKTPLLPIENLHTNTKVKIYAKAEWKQLSGSVKERAPYFIMKKAIEKGDLYKNKILPDATSGTTGIAYTSITKVLFTFLLYLASFASFAQKETDYKKEIDNWHKKREENLKTENGWLNLAGLFWLQEGKNTFGSSDKNQIQFPVGTIDPFAGYFERTDNIVKIIVNKEVNIKLNGKPIREAIIFHPDSIKPLVLSYKDLKWVIIKREDKIGIRLRNLKSPLLESFQGIDRFPVDATWKIEARLVTSNQPIEIPITNVLGQTTKEKSAGKLVFTINDKEYALDALEEDDGFFILFSDETSGNETYPSGRFLSASKADKNGNVLLDFNKATNPPCAFTSFATCPLPPSQNRLPIAVTAGEKIFGEH